MASFQRRLTSDGEIRYPEYPSIEPRKIDKTDFVRVGNNAPFRVLGMKLRRIERRSGVFLKVVGRAATLRTGIANANLSTDRRLTRFETLRNDPTLVALFGLVVWIFGTTLGAWKLWKELRG